jgi:hypothetical protein
MKQRADAQQQDEPAKEAACHTAQGGKQAGMTDAECVFIASQIPVLASAGNDIDRTESHGAPDLI